jgi:hypothetical protein
MVLCQCHAVFIVMALYTAKDQWVTKEVREETKKFIESNENENTIYQNL